MLSEDFSFPGTDVHEPYTDAEPGRGTGDLALQSNLGLPKPQRDFELGVRFQRDRHFHKAASQADVGCLAEHIRFALGPQFYWDIALYPRGLASLATYRWTEGVHHAERQVEIP